MLLSDSLPNRLAEHVFPGFLLEGAFRFPHQDCAALLRENLGITMIFPGRAFGLLQKRTVRAVAL